MKTILGILIDRSGSMISIASDMNGGISNFIKDQAKEPGDCTLILSQFDNVYEDIYHDDIKNYNLQFQLQPRNSTALCDAIMKISAKIEEEIVKGPIPDHVVLMIVTDGYENASQEVSKAQIKDLVEQKEKDNWNILYLGGGDSFYEGSEEFSVSRDCTAGYACNSVGTNNAFKMSSDKIKTMRGMSCGTRVSSYTDEERELLVSNDLADVQDWDSDNLWKPEDEKKSDK